MPNEAKHTVQTTETTLRILQQLKTTERMGVTELADSLDIGKSGVHNHLSTLREHGYVVKDGEKYRLSLQFLDLGGVVRSRIPLYEAAKAEVKSLAEEVGELASLATLEADQGIYLYRARSESAVNIDRHVGQRTHLHSTGLGKSMLAQLPESEVREVIDEHGLPADTDDTITDVEELFAELKAIRDRGYAVDDEERLEGLRCVAAPVKTSETLHGAVSVTGPISRLRGEWFKEELPDLVGNRTNIIELNLKEP